MTHRWIVLLVTFLLLSIATARNLVRLPSRSECRALATTENCMTEEMQLYCQASCIDHQMREILKKNRIPMAPKSQSFYDLSALDIRGNPVDFRQFQGKVVIVTNVASYCDLTTKHYNEMIALYSKFQHLGLEILAFPCNQFGAQEPYSNSNIHAFCERMGVEFRMMEKIEVNGPGVHSVYRFLKERVGPDEIKGNFGSYYLIRSDGRVTGFNGGSSQSLESYVEAAIKG